MHTTTAGNWFWGHMTPAAFNKMNGRERMMASMRGGAGVARVGVEESSASGMRTGMRFGDNDASRAIGLVSRLEPTLQVQPAYTAPTVTSAVDAMPVASTVTRLAPRQVLQPSTSPRPTIGVQMLEPERSAAPVDSGSTARPRFAPGTVLTQTPEFADEAEMPVWEGKAIKSVEEFRAQKPILNVQNAAGTAAQAVGGPLASIPTWVKVVGVIGLSALVLKMVSK